MPFQWHLKPIIIYIFLLIISFGITINAYSFLILNLIFYLLIHFILIYIGIYYYKKFLFFIFFLSGILLDLSLLNEIGPHLLTFMILIIFLSRVQKMLIRFNSLKMIFFIIIVLFLVLFLEKIITYLLFNYTFDIEGYLKSIFLSFLIIFPVFFFFQKIDNMG